MKTTLVIWHGYLLGATGSNIYTRQLVASWLRAGHDVVLSCQEPRPEQYPEIHEHVVLGLDGDGTAVERERRTLRQPQPTHGRCTMVVPDIAHELPVYVLDRYEGFRVTRVVDLDDAALERYARAHAAAMRWVISEHDPAGVLVNHAAPLPAALADTLAAAGVPFAVKVHGSELEYALADDPRLRAPAAAALQQASRVLVGSEHIARRTVELLGSGSVGERLAIIPPGVDLQRFHPIADDAAARRSQQEQLVRALQAHARAHGNGRTAATSRQIGELLRAAPGDARPTARLVPQLAALHGTYQERDVEVDAARAVESIDIAGGARLVVYVGKLIPQKGVHLLLAALPLVARRVPHVRLVVAGFGPLRDGLEALLVAMTRGDAATIDELAATMGELAGEAPGALPHLQAFLEQARADGTFDGWLADAARHQVDEMVSWLGLVDHEVLSALWPLAETSVVPSVLAEAFGMVAAEAAACGCVPLVSGHSGLADAAAVIERDGVAPVRFATEPPEAAIPALADALVERLTLPAAERARQAAAARDSVAAEWGWDELAARVADCMTAAPAAVGKR